MLKVLVAYASRRGATAEIAEAIADKLREFELQVECRPADTVGGLQGYDAVVLGSAVYFNRWLGEARVFLRRNEAELARMPFWAFSSGPVGEGEPNGDVSEPHRTIRIVEGLHARGHVVFGGHLGSRRGGVLERTVVSRIPRSFRDRRDWAEIRTWAATIGVALSAVSAPRAAGIGSTAVRGRRERARGRG